MNTIGERIKEARLNAGYTQTELAEKMNISKQLLYRYETGKITNIPSDKIEMIANICRVDPWDILGWHPMIDALEDTNHNPEYVLSGLNSNESVFIEKFRLLDDIDQNRIVERIDTMLEDDKYKKADKGDKVG